MRRFNIADQASAGCMWGRWLASRGLAPSACRRGRAMRSGRQTVPARDAAHSRWAALRARLWQATDVTPARSSSSTAEVLIVARWEAGCRGGPAGSTGRSIQQKRPSNGLGGQGSQHQTSHWALGVLGSLTVGWGRGAGLFEYGNGRGAVAYILRNGPRAGV
jgi:hypothetical protein